MLDSCSFRIRTSLSARRVLTASALGMVILVSGCQRQQNPAPEPAPHQEQNAPAQSPRLPSAVLALTPPITSPIVEGRDISKDKPAVLRGQAFGYAGKESFKEAAQCQYWIVQQTDQGQYDLACWESLSGRTDAALYWLQEAGRREGVYARWAQEDPDLEKARLDPRWPKLLVYLQGCEKYWRAVSPKETVVVVPKGYDGQTELPVVVWLHGMGGSPANMGVLFQSLADRHQIGFVGVSGTIPTGKHKFAWADVAEDDYDRIRLALVEADKQIRRRTGMTVTLGFSQGAMVAIEVTVRHPETFAGAITISAGTGSPVQLDAVSAKTGLPRQGFVIVCGAKENQWSVKRSHELADWLKAGKAKVLQPDYPNHSTHSFPADFGSRLPEWLVFIEQARQMGDP